MRQKCRYLQKDPTSEVYGALGFLTEVYLEKEKNGV